MKKLFLLAALLFGGLGISHVEAAEDIPLEIVNDSEAGSGNTKAPPLVISQEDNVLTLPVMADDFVLELRDEYGCKVISNIPNNDSVLVNIPEVARTESGVVNMPESSPGSTMYQTNNLRVVFLGYQHLNYGGERICIVPDNGKTKKHERLDNIGWNDKMSSCTLS